MKLYTITAAHTTYDQYDSLVVAASSALEAVTLTLDPSAVVSTIDNHSFRFELPEHYSAFDYTARVNAYFKRGQSPLTVTEVKLDMINQPTVIIGSFMAG